MRLNDNQPHFQHFEHGIQFHCPHIHPLVKGRNGLAIKDGFPNQVFTVLNIVQCQMNAVLRQL